MALLTFFIGGQIKAAETAAETFALVDEKHQSFMAFYLDKGSSSSAGRFENIESLQHSVRQSGPLDALLLIKANLPLVESRVDSPAVLEMLGLLLEHNDWQSAVELFETIKRDSHKTIISNARFAMARHHFKRNEWQRALDHLEGIGGDLDSADYEHATLMQGVALQRLKKHRQAIELYKKIPSTSPLHPSATVNLAVAYIRQGWWTDAQAVIDTLMKSSDDGKSLEVRNRLNVILGYALMQQGYYRNARDAFRNVSLDSQYTNRALLGIVLTAISQDDYSGALNAINLLKERQGSDLSSQEAHLMQPFIYARLNQYLTAAAGYSSAIDYYGGEIESLERLLSMGSELTTEIAVNKDGNTVSVGGYEFGISQEHPPAFFENHAKAAALDLHGASDTVRQQHAALMAGYNTLLAAVARELLTERQEQLKSYMDQSRYGTALLYDKSIAK